MANLVQDIAELRVAAHVGGAFSEAFFIRAHACSPLESTYIISSVEHGVLTGDFAQPGVIGLAAFVTHGMMLRHGIAYRRDVFIPHVCMEVLNINIAAAKRLTQPLSRVAFVEASRHFAQDILNCKSRSVPINRLRLYSCCCSSSK